MAEKMNPEIKARWVEYLRDGTRTQGIGVLRDANGNQCCLDVLCEIAVEDRVIAPPEFEDDRYWYTGNVSIVLPLEVMEWAGLDDDSPYVKWIDPEGAEHELMLSELNDAMCVTFPELADLIEEQL